MVILCKSLAGFGLAALGLVGCVDPAEKPGDSQAGSVNVLFIITDQQRFDALSRAGNAELETPNLDQLARTGAYFATAYTPAPICVPARTAILTGHSPKSIGVVRNSDINSKEILSVPSFDGILARAGYHTEYYGKWHAPYRLAATYRNEVRPHSENQGAPADVPTRSEALRRFIDTHVAPGCPSRAKSCTEVSTALMFLTGLIGTCLSRRRSGRWRSETAKLPTRPGFPAVWTCPANTAGTP